MRRLSLSLYALVALAELIHWAIVPLLPALTDRFGLSELESSALVASTGVATLAVSLPAGVLADRLDARRLTLWAGVTLTVATVAQALAPSYALLLAARLVFGAGFGIVWTAGLAWLAAVTPERSGSSMGASVTSAGVGTVLAPGFAGLAAQALGLAAPFLVAAAAAAAVTAALLTAGRSGTAPLPPERTTAAAARAAVREPGVTAALAAVLVAGMAGGMISVLGPIELHAAGFAEGTIGLAFSAAALVFIAASAATVRSGARLIGVIPVQAGTVVIAVALLPAAASGAAVAVIATLCLSAPLRALLYTVAYPLGAARAPRAGVGPGTVMGLVNAMWALTTVVGPLAGGALAASVGARGSYGLLQALALATAGGVWLHARRRVPALA